MCAPVDPMTAFAVVSQGVQLLGGARDARNAASASDQQASNEAQASAERAARLWRQGQQVLSQQRAEFLAAPGVEAGTGSALEVGANDAAELRTDMLTEAFGGYSRAIALKKEAKDLRASARLQLGMAGGAAAALIPSVWKTLGGSSGGLAKTGAPGLAKALGR